MMHLIACPYVRLGTALLCVAAATGCGAPTATVTGKVTVNGATVTAGAVTFHGEKDYVQSATIDANGNYTLGNVPVGPVKVAVVSAKPRAMPGGKAATAKHPGDKGGAGVVSAVPVPDKYKDPNQSGLAFEIKAGEQTIDLPLQ
jgi:hypothetical protein